MGRVTTGSRWTGGPRPSLGTSCSVSTGSPANSVDGQNCRSSGPLPADDVISCKFAIPHLAGHTPQPTPRRFPHASDPHTGHILTQPQSDYAPAETSVRLTRIKRQPAYSKRLGGMGMASLGDAASTSTAASMTTTTGGDAACQCDRAIGPEGPITVKPKGLTGLKARL